MSALNVQKHEFVFTNIEVAKRASLAFMECNRKFWSSPEGFASYHLLADAMAIAVKAGIMDLKDLMLTDTELYDKLRNSGNADVTGRLRMRTGLTRAVPSHV